MSIPSSTPSNNSQEIQNQPALAPASAPSSSRITQLRARFESKAQTVTQLAQRNLTPAATPPSNKLTKRPITNLTTQQNAALPRRVPITLAARINRPLPTIPNRQPLPTDIPARSPPNRPLPPIPSVSVTKAAPNPMFNHIFNELTQTEMTFHNNMIESEKFWNVYCKFEPQDRVALEMLKNISAIKHESGQLIIALEKIKQLPPEKRLEALNSYISSPNFMKYVSAGQNLIAFQKIFAERPMNPEQVVTHSKNEKFKETINSLNPSQNFHDKYLNNYNPILALQRLPRLSMLAEGLEKSRSEGGIKAPNENKLSTFLKIQTAEANEKVRVFEDEIAPLKAKFDEYNKAEGRKKIQLRRSILKDFQSSKNPSLGVKDIYDHQASKIIKDINTELSKLTGLKGKLSIYKKLRLNSQLKDALNILYR